MANHSCELCTSLGVETKFWTLNDQKTHAQFHASQLTRISDDTYQPSVKEIFGKCFPLDDFEKSEEIEKSRSTLFEICQDIIKSKKNDSGTIKCQQCLSDVRYMKAGWQDTYVILCHACTHSTKKPFVCRRCKVESPTKVGMERHIKQIHMLASPVSGEHFGESWTDCFDEIKKSLMQCFGDLQLDPGSSSKRRTPPSKLAVQRRSIFLKVRKSTDNAKKIKCAQCQKEITTRYSAHLEEHIRSHLQRRIFECKLCKDSTTTYKRGIEKHLTQEHGVSSTGNYIDRSDEHHREIMDLAKQCFGKDEAE